MSKSSQRQFLVKVEGIPGYWAQKTGGNISADSAKAYDGGSLIPDILTSPPTAENIVVTRHFDPQRDGDIMRQLRPQVGSYESTLSVTPTNADLVAVDKPTVYPSARLTGLSEPESDSGSGEPAMWGLTFAISNYR